MKKRLIWAGLVTLIAFPLIGFGLLWCFRENPLEVMLRSQIAIPWQLLIGLPIGFLFGKIAAWIIARPILRASGDKYARVVQRMGISPLGVVLLSFCAGFGEELLFRGSVQPLIGIWFTALIFVAIHGYLDPRDWRITIYGAAMVLIIAALGWMTERLGVFGAGAAHMMIDVVLFNYLLRQKFTDPNEIQIA